jgi:solute carrier family 50 protein (sugar transporter)
MDNFDPWLGSKIALGAQGASVMLSLAPSFAMLDISREKSTGQRPLLPYSATFVNGVTWTCYGLLAPNNEVVLTNSFQALCGFTCSLIFAMYMPANADNLPYTFKHHVTFACAWGLMLAAIVLLNDKATACDLLGKLGCGICMVMYSGPMAAIQTVVQSRSTASLSFPYTVATTLNCTLWFLMGMLVNKDFYIWSPNVLGLAAAAVQFALFAVYRKGKRGTKDDAQTGLLLSK